MSKLKDRLRERLRSMDLFNYYFEGKGFLTDEYYEKCLKKLRWRCSKPHPEQ